MMTEARRGNGFDPETTRRFVADIEQHLDELDGLAASHKEACAAVRTDIKAVYESAKEAGVPKGELRSVIKERMLQRKIEALRADLADLDRMETYDQIRLALGMLSDTPLGEAALPAAKTDADIAAENAEMLRLGINRASATRVDLQNAGGGAREDLSDIADAVS